MATDIEINYAINAAESQNTLRGINKELKNLISLQGQVQSGTASFRALQGAINKTEGKLSELTTSFQTLRGSGVERLNSSIGIFRDGLLNADTEKLKIGLQGLGAAMKAIPIFLLIEGVTLLFQNFDKVVGFVKNLTGAFGEEERAMKALNEQYTQQIAANSQLANDLDNEVKLLKAKRDPLEKILAAEQASFNLKIANIRLTIEQEKLTQKQVASTRSLTDTFLAYFGAYTGNLGLVAKANEDTFKKFDESGKKISELQTQLKNTEVNKEVSRVETLNAIRDREAQAREKRIAEVQERIKIKEDNALREEMERLQEEQRAHEEAIAADIKIAQEHKAFIQAINEGNAALDAQAQADAEEKARSRRRRVLDNQIADERAHQKLTIAEKIAAIERQRDIELAQEQITVDQRVAIIRKAEGDILAIRTASVQQSIAIVQQQAQVLSALNDFVNQQENQRLNDMQVAKDTAIQEDQERTQQAVERERQFANQQLQSTSLTEQQKANIRASTENKIIAIEKGSRNNQLAIEGEFQKQQLKIKKAQFEKEKTLRLVNIAIDTASALVKTTAELGGVGAITPAGAAILAGIVALGITQGAIVASQEFDESTTSAAPISVGGGGGFTPSGPTGSEGPSRTPGAFNPDAVKAQDNRPKKLGVLEADISGVVEKVAVLESRATFGV